MAVVLARTVVRYVRKSVLKWEREAISDQQRALSEEKKTMNPRKSNSDGTIYQLPSGHWRAQVCIDRRRLSATRRTRAEARDWVREINDQIGQGMTYDASQTQLDQFIYGWLETKRFNVRTATYDLYETMIRVYIIPRLGKIKLIELTPAVVRGFVDGMARGGVGARTVQLVYGVLQNALATALETGLVGRNPVSVVRRPRVARHEMHV